MRKLLQKGKDLPRWLRYTLLTALITAAVGGAIYGVLCIIRGQGKEVNVYAASDLCMYASGGNAQSTGMVTTDKIQSVYTSSTQQITEISVKEGDHVSVGDPILSFDTTLTDLELERQDISVRQLELDLENAKKNQALINTYRVFTPSQTQTPEEPTLTPAALPLLRKGTGEESDPLVYVWNDDCAYDSAFLEKILPHTAGATVCVVFEVRSGDSVQGGILRSWEMIFRRAADDGWSFTVVTPDYDPGDGEDADDGNYEDFGSGYTWADLVQMKRAAAQKIIDLDLQLKQAKLKYETLKYELTNGVVTAKIEGVVKSVLDPDEALANNKPVVLISGGGGYYVTGALSEIEKQTMSVGDTVTVQSWESYVTLEGTITSISDYPDTAGQYSHYSDGNQNVSLYPFTVFLPEDAGLRENEWVQLTYNPDAGQGTGLYLQSAFVRTDGGSSYIWCANADGRLEKRTVRTGRSLWGSYLEILSGMTTDDRIAFPYGRDVKAGAPTRLANVQELYTY